MPLLTFHKVAEIIRWKQELGRFGVGGGKALQKLSCFLTYKVCAHIKTGMRNMAV